LINFNTTNLAKIYLEVQRYWFRNLWRSRYDSK